MPHTNDDALLARLNALKQSSVTLSTAPPGAEGTPDALRDLGVSAAADEPVQDDPILDLAARFKRLNNSTPSPSSSPRSASKAARATTGDAPGGPEEEKSLDELLKELGGDEWDISKHEEKDVGALVREVRSVLPDVPTPKAESSSQDKPNVESGEEEAKQEDEVDQDALDEQEADEYIAQVLAELEMDIKYAQEEGDEGTEGAESVATEQKKDETKETEKYPSLSPGETAAPALSQNPSDEKDGSSSAEPALSLPAAPTDLPTPPPAAAADDFDRATAVDDALTARLAALSRGSPSPGNGSTTSLPSAPSFAPSKKPPVKASTGPKFTDEEIDSWCIICYDDATVRCLGCDSDLYCQKCWNEGHRGESAGYEERMHRAVQFVKGGELKKVPVGAG